MITWVKHSITIGCWHYLYFILLAHKIYIMALFLCSCWHYFPPLHQTDEWDLSFAVVSIRPWTHSSMELYSRRRRTTRLAQKSNMYFAMHVLHNFGAGLWKIKQLITLGPSSPSTNSLHLLTAFISLHQTAFISFYLGAPWPILFAVSAMIMSLKS